MPHFDHHVLICTQQKLEDKPYCSDHGAEAILLELKRLLERHDLQQRVLVTPCGCLGLCRMGPNMVVYPAGTWYAQLDLEDLPEIVTAHLGGGRPVQRLAQRDAEQRWEMIRVRMERDRAEEAAHREAGVLPEPLRALASDFWASRAFLTAVELDLFTALEGGATAVEAAERMGTDPRATEMLLNAMTSQGLLERSGARYENGPETSLYLRRGAEDDARGALMHRVNMWDSWSTLTECVREGSTILNNMGAPSFTQAFIAATHKIATLAAPALVSSLDLRGVRRVLDVGGGSGAYTVAVLQAHPEATAELLDRPPVIRQATRYVREAGLADRVRLRPGDFLVDPLGDGFDLVLLSYVLHLNNPETNRRLLAKAFAALEPGGRLVINDYVLNREKTLPRHAALYALNMLVSTPAGTVYSHDEIAALLSDTGFQHTTRVPLLGPTDLVTAVKP
jgi:(2Fe-2S) ferredoxin/SAM-dependent methyltransferase